MTCSGKNGGTVPVRACRLHAVVERREWIRQPARPRTPALPRGKTDQRAVASRNAAALACNGRSRQFHVTRRLQSWHGRAGQSPEEDHLLWVNCGKPRLGRSTQGADIRLPGPATAWVTERGRCTWFRQCRQARDTDPSLPEPSRSMYSYDRDHVKDNFHISGQRPATCPSSARWAPSPVRGREKAKLIKAFSRTFRGRRCPTGG